MPAPRVSSGWAATASDFSEKADASSAVATSGHSPARKLPPMTDCGAKPIEWTTPSRWSVCSRTQSARAARSSAFVTSSSTTGASVGSRRAVTWVSRSWRPKEVRMTVAPSCWARRATWKAIELSLRTPVTRRVLPSRSPIAVSCREGGSVAHAESAVDGDDGPGDVGGGGRGEVLDGADDVGDVPEAAGRDRGAQLVLLRLGQRPGHVGVDEAGGDDVGGDVPRAELAGDGACHADEAGLGGGVVGLAGVAVHPDDGAHEDDASAALADHALGHPPHAAEDAGEVDVEDLLELLVAHPHEQLVARHAGVGDEDLDRHDARPAAHPDERPGVRGGPRRESTTRLRMGGAWVRAHAAH